MKQFNSQQPDVKDLARQNGEGECTDVGLPMSGSVNLGKIIQYPSADNLCFWGKK